jgi:hypothetical protein
MVRFVIRPKTILGPHVLRIDVPEPQLEDLTWLIERSDLQQARPFGFFRIRPAAIPEPLQKEWISGFRCQGNHSEALRLFAAFCP